MKRSQAELHGEREAIKGVLGGFPDGAGVVDVAAKLEVDITLHGLRRQLKRLQSEGLVEITGRGRGTRYKAVTVARARDDGTAIPFSKESLDILELVRRPLQARTPVGYQRELLDDYKPNDTFYLTEAERGRLWETNTLQPVDQAAGTYATKILDRLLIDLSWKSSSLEGNTHSLLDTTFLIERGGRAEGKSAEEVQMILNHKNAIEFLVDCARDIGFDRRTIFTLHGLLAENLLGNPQNEGKLRHGVVEIGASVYSPMHVPQRIEECFDLILAKAAAIGDPFEQSLFAMVHLPYLQPFIDVNKRVSRLAANIPLIRRNLSPLSFIGVGRDDYVQALLAVYELNSVEPVKEMFVWACERSADRYLAIRREVGEPDQFRMRHRDAIHAIVVEVVANALNQPQAARVVAEAAGRWPAAERGRFTETVENEILAVNEGNIHRYRIQPSEFEAWRKAWISE